MVHRTKRTVLMFSSETCTYFMKVERDSLGLPSVAVSLKVNFSSDTLLVIRRRY